MSYRADDHHEVPNVPSNSCDRKFVGSLRGAQHYLVAQSGYCSERGAGNSKPFKFETQE